MSLRGYRVVGCPVSQPSAPQASSAPGRIDPQLTSEEARGCAHLHVIVGAEALAFGFFGDGQELGAAARSTTIHAFKA